MSYQVTPSPSSMRLLYATHNNSQALDNSLIRLSTGLRINNAADDPASLVLADALLSQSNAFGQAMMNANDGIGMMQTADAAIGEQYSLLDTIKTKATQAAQDGQTLQTRQTLQSDISSLLASLDAIASTTTYNGQSLLSGGFTNKTFQIGALSYQALHTSIGATSSDKIGQVWFKTGGVISTSTTSQLSFTKPTGIYDVALESVKISTSAGTGLGSLAEVINKNSELLGGVSASYQVTTTGSAQIASGSVSNLTLNGVLVASSLSVQKGDSDGSLVSSINQASSSTGVTASLDARGYLELTSADGRGIKISGTNLTTLTSIGSAGKSENYGRLTLTKIGGKEIGLTGGAGVQLDATHAKDTLMNLRDALGLISQSQAEAMGFFPNSNTLYNTSTFQTTGVLTTSGAQAMMKIADAAMQHLDAIRSSIGSTQNALSSAYTNASSMQIQTKAGEASLREVDFAQESATFSKLNILVQAGNYALSQANTTQAHVLKLLEG